MRQNLAIRRVEGKRWWVRCRRGWKYRGVLFWHVCCCCDHLMSLWAFIQIALIVVCMGVRVPCFNALHVFVTSHLVSSRVQDVKPTNWLRFLAKPMRAALWEKNEGFPNAKMIVRQKRSNYLERSAISDICNVHFSMHNHHMKMSVTVVYFLVFLQTPIAKFSMATNPAVYLRPLHFNVFAKT